MIHRTYVFSAWNSACAMLLNFFPQSLHFIDLATSPSLRASGSILASVSGLVISSIDLSWLASSHSRAPWTVDISVLENDMMGIYVAYGLPSSWLRFLHVLSQSPSPRAVPNLREPLWRGICKAILGKFCGGTVIVLSWWWGRGLLYLGDLNSRKNH